MNTRFSRSLFTLIATAFISTSLAASANAQSNPSQITSNADLSHEQRVQLGEMDYRTYCAPCHGVTGIGDGPVASELTRPTANLTKLSTDDQLSFDEIKMIVDGRNMPRAHGTSEMPVWGVWFSAAANAAGLLQDDITTTEAVVNARIERLVDYLNTLQK
ncbi:MAG: c-type cytochrome [Hyphomicrobiales bacterium]